MKAKKGHESQIKDCKSTILKCYNFFTWFGSLELIGWKMPLVEIQRSWQPLKGRLKVVQLNETYALSWFFWIIGMLYKNLTKLKEHNIRNSLSEFIIAYNIGPQGNFSKRPDPQKSPLTLCRECCNTSTFFQARNVKYQGKNAWNHRQKKNTYVLILRGCRGIFVAM